MELELREYIEIILKRIWIIVAITITATFLSGIISVFFLNEVYSTSTTLIVSKQSEGTTLNEMQINDINLARGLVDTYSVIVKSDLVMEKVLKEVRSDMSLGSLRSKVSVSSEGNTEIIRITVEDTQPEKARDIANSLARVFMNEVESLLRMDNVQIIDIAKAPVSPIKPKVMMNIAIAFILGLMISLGIVLLLEYLDNTIKTPEDVQKYMGLPVIGIIPSFDE